MWNKVTKNIKNSFTKNINFFINAYVRKCFFPIKLFDGSSCSTRSDLNKVEDLQYVSTNLQNLSHDDNLDAVKSVHQSQLSNWVET